VFCIAIVHRNTFSADLIHRPHRMVLHSCDVGVVDKEEKGPPGTIAGHHRHPRQVSMEGALRFPFLRVHHPQTHQDQHQYFLFLQFRSYMCVAFRQSYCYRLEHYVHQQPCRPRTLTSRRRGWKGL
jgi:hypothetical protein